MRSYYDAKEIARLGIRIAPRGKVPPVLHFALLDLVPITEQHRIGSLVRLDSYLVEYRHIVRSIGIKRDATKAHGLALGTIHGAGLVQPRQLGIRLRFDFHTRNQFGSSFIFQQLRGYGERIPLDGIVGTLDEIPPVELDGEEG